MILNNKVHDDNVPKDSATVNSALTLDTVANRMEQYEGSVTSMQTDVASMQTEVAAMHNAMNRNNLMLSQICSHLNLSKPAARTEGSGGKKS